jgi:citrate lyase subunit beta/citryl-CoA lyase
MTTPPLDQNHSLPLIAPCEHMAGNERFIRKAFDLQTQNVHPSGRSLVDVTMDLEDGAPVGQEAAMRQTVVDLLNATENSFKQSGIRVHSPDSPFFEDDITHVVRLAAPLIAYITIPKIKSSAEIRSAERLISSAQKDAGVSREIPLHVIIETPEALRHVEEIAAIPAVQVLDFGIMDFISHLGGAIPSECMRSPGQFDHRLLSAAKERICMAALGHGKIPSHNVTVDFRNPESAFSDAQRARTEFGFLRMWSIHPLQIEPILRAMLPSSSEVTEAREIIALAAAASWGPVEHNGRLHDRASFRYYAQVLQRVS